MGKGIVKLGEGNWAVKDGNLLAAKETNGRFKNTEFTVSRGTRASYVGRDGLIKESNLQDVNLVNNGDFSELGSELVTNGTFDTDSDWTKGTGWSIEDGKASCDGAGALTSQNIIDQNKTYLVSFDVVNYTSGDIRTVFSGDGATYSENINSVGTYTRFVTSSITSGKLQFFPNSSFNGSIDNVSVKEVDPNDYWVLGSGWSIEDGKLVGDGAESNASQSGVVQNGNTYKITLTAYNITTGYISARIGSGGTENFQVNSNGTQTFYATADNGTFVLFRNQSGFDGSIDNVSVKEVKTDTPRIDFTDNTDGHLLLEPQSTNLITYSEDFTQWTKSNASNINVIATTIISPDGVSFANKLYPISTGSSSYIRQNAAAECFSIFVKKGERRWILIYGGFANSNVWFDSENGVLGTVKAEATATVESFSNDWYRIKIIWTQNSTQVRLYNTDDDNTLVSTANNTDGLYIWGAQLEQLSHSTSYIATNGSTVTRDADTCTGAGDAIDFNSEEGVLYAEIAALETTSSGSNYISISDGTYNNRASILFTSGSTNNIRFFLGVGGTLQIDTFESVTDVKSFNKVALKYKENDFAVWINGVEVATDTSGNVWASGTINQLAFTEIGTTFGAFRGKCKALRVYKEALSDTDLQNLTS